MSEPSTTAPQDSVGAPAAPPEAEPAMTAEQLAEAQRYGRIKLHCDLADTLLDLVYLGVAAFGFAAPLDAWLAAQTDSLVLRFIGMYLTVLLGHYAVSFPLTFYDGFLVERQFALSRQSVGDWLVRYGKQAGLALAFGLSMFAGLYLIIWAAGAWWWLVAAAVFFVVSVVLGQLVPVLILPIFYKIERFESPELDERLQRLAHGTGLSIEGTYRMALSAETVKGNAMLAGLGRTRRVLLGDTILEGFSPEEIEVIFAHEIGHHVHRHIPKLIALGVVTSGLGLWLCDQALQKALGSSDFHRTGLPIAAMPTVMFLLTLFSVLLGPLQNAISRRFERQCDLYALRRTGHRDSYRSAFRKLARLNKDDPHPPALEVLLFHSHPPIAERLALADKV